MDSFRDNEEELQRLDENEDSNVAASEEAVSYETAIDKIGVNLMQYLVLAACGMGNAVDAVEILSVSYILPQLKDAKIISEREVILHFETQKTQ